MDKNSNVNLEVLQGDFPIKYGPKSLKHPWSICYKNLGYFKSTFLNTMGNYFFLLFLNTDQKENFEQ